MTNGAIRRATAPETVSMQTRDGIRLDADIYWPDPDRHGEGPFPVLLMRQPHGRRLAATAHFAHPTWYADQGYIVVIQDVRGCGSSQGQWRLIESEFADGADTIAWTTTLPRANGTLGMYGAAYEGMTQLFAAIGAADRGIGRHLKALAPAMIAWDVHDDWVFEGGALRLAEAMDWALRMAAQQARQEGDEAAFNALAAAAAAPPLDDPIPCRPAVLETHRQDGFYLDWVANDRRGPYWDAMAPRFFLDRIPDVPMLHVGGWYDFMLAGTLAAHDDLSREKTAPQSLIVGPWTHRTWGRRAGDLDQGDAAVSPVDLAQVRWFNRFLKEDNQRPDPAVRLFQVGGNRWVEGASWPAAEEKSLYLAGDGLAAARSDAGRLVDTVPGVTGSDSFVHDPWRPVPALGGHWAEPGGSTDRGKLDDRGDVAVYSTAPLDRDLDLAGALWAELWVEADRPSYDLACTVSRVTPDGRVLTLAQGYRRVDETEEPVTVDLRALSARVPAGDALRLSIAGAAFPAFPVNPGTGARHWYARRLDQRTITLSIGSGAASPSRLIVPETAL